MGLKNKESATHVDAYSDRYWDAGSIPAASNDGILRDSVGFLSMPFLATKYCTCKGLQCVGARWHFRFIPLKFTPYRRVLRRILHHPWRQG